MNKKLISISGSLMVLSMSAQADNIKVTCEELGYTVPVSDCLEQGSMPLLCPVASGETDAEKMSLCYSDACRGFPLWKEGDTYYHLDKNGNKVEAAPENGKIGDFIEGGEAALLQCKTGLTENAQVYYKVEKCIEGAILDYDICVDGCGRTKYPYDKHPGDLAGAVASCEDAEGEHFGYTSCNDGWNLDKGKCILASCDIKQFPYKNDPNLINNENRGETKTCRIGGNIYYRYISCDDANVDSGGKSVYELRKGVCAKRCELKDCSKTEVTVENCIPVRSGNGTITSYNDCSYNDWSCNIDSTCRVGDIVTYDSKDLGVIYHLKNGEGDKNLIVSFSAPVKSIKWGAGEYEAYDLPNITCSHNKSDYQGKLNTKKIISFTDDYAKNFPGLAYCYNYTKDCPNGSVCAKGEWYMPGMGELSYLHDDIYIVYNTTYFSTYVNSGQNASSFFTSCETGASSAGIMSTVDNMVNSNYKSATWPNISPILAF